MPNDIWPNFEAQLITRSSRSGKQIACPYTLKKNKLGTGSYADVYECKNTETGKHYAAKQFSKKLIYGNESMLQREFEVLRAVSRGHPNILSMVDYFETSSYFYLVTDLALGGDLFDRITKAPRGRLTPEETRDILSVLLSAINHLHMNKIVHRDIKSENILFSSKSSKPGSLLLADFGQARIMKDNEMAYTVEGTLSYIAPEVLSRTGHSFPVDMWAVGVLTYFMLSGYMPFDCDNDAETRQMIIGADFIFEPEEYWIGISNQAKDFIRLCLTLNPQERITANQAISHSFISAHAGLKPAFSFNSLQKLQSAVIEIQRSRQDTSSEALSTEQSETSLKSKKQVSSLSLTSQPVSESNFTTSTSSRENLEHALLGVKCPSPALVTKFNTPSTSASQSRQISSTELYSSVSQNSSSSTAAPQMLRRTGDAKFVF